MIRPGPGRRAGTRRDGGNASVEFALVVALFLILLLGIIDFTRALWAWNRLTQATRTGARYATVHDPVALNVRGFDGTAVVPAGRAVPAAALVPNPTVCTAAGCGPGPDAADAALLDAAAFGRLVARMRRADRRLAAANVIVEYRHVGLGLAGNPAGPDLDPLVTVRLRDVRFDFLAIAFLGVRSIALPDFRATLPAEDGRDG